MALVTHSEKRNRTYPRKFDHDEARALRAEGWTYKALARKYGVSPSAIARVCDPRIRDAMQESANSWNREHQSYHQRPCLGGCGKSVWQGGSGFCQSCTVTFGNVEPDQLRCLACGEWKPDVEFDIAKSQGRRGRAARCKVCRARKQRERRPANGWW